MRRELKVGLKVLIGLALVGLAVPAGAGPFDKVKKSASETTKKAGDAADKTSKAADDVSNAAGKDAGAKSEGGSPAESGSAGKETGGSASKTSGSSEKVSSVSTKFDFVSGDSLMFFDDFTRDDLGEFPARWKLSQGTFEVAEMEGERWLRSVSQDGTIRMKMPAAITHVPTIQMMRLASALTSGLTPNLTFE